MFTTELREYVRNPDFCRALGIPLDAELDIRPLAHGEYHKNYVFDHPVTGQKLVLRINYGSQMHLDRQIEYEYRALRALETSGRTPRALYVDGSRERFPQGLLVMEFLAGRPLDYDRDLTAAARALADVHATKITDPDFLVTNASPIGGILAECRDMFSVYQASRFRTGKTCARIEKMLEAAENKSKALIDESWQHAIINTELNNHNFIVDAAGRVSVIDWEKPLWGDPAQDLGHMLAPTTSYWKTDRILTMDEADRFADLYLEAADGRIRLGDFKARLKIFLQVTCMRGITELLQHLDESGLAGYLYAGDHLVRDGLGRV